MWISPLILTELEQLKQLQQGSGNAAKERPVTSYLKWPHESGHQAVGGVDFSSARHHLTPVAVYLAWSLADANWCRHLFALPVFGSWSSSLSRFLCLTSSRCHFLHTPLQHASLLDILHLTMNNMIICSGQCVSRYYTYSFSVSLSVSQSLSLSQTHLTNNWSEFVAMHVSSLDFSLCEKKPNQG